MVTRRTLGTMLQKELRNSFDVDKIAQWAEKIYANHCRELSTELDSIIMAISCMEHGSEFEFTERELKLLSDKLISEEIDPLEQVLNLRKNNAI